VNLEPAWKQEVNRRVAAHLNRKTPLDGESGAPKGPQLPPASRAAQAAARVAARYAKAPSYNEMLAAEARAAILAAEAASQAALEAQVAAQVAAHVAAESVLASLEAAAASERAWEPQRPEPELVEPETIDPQPAGLELGGQHFEPAERELPATQGARHDREFAVRWEPDMPPHGHQPAAMRATHAATHGPTHGAAERPGNLDFGSRGYAEPLPLDPLRGQIENGEIEVVEPALPIYANLIEFPRQLIAARRVRPRLAEGPLAVPEPGAQLSIFEVDPGAISIEPEAASADMEAGAPAWTEPEWRSIKLDAQPAQEFFPAPLPQAHPEPAAEAALKLAPINRRLLAIAVDFALVLGVFAAMAYLVLSKTATLPGLRTAEIGSAAGLLVIAALYESLFLSLTGVTAGMWYAQLRLCTFDNEIPDPAKRNTRLVALLVSIVPMGLGMVWAIFDDDHLTWHDRLSRTYLRQY
jgi:uncharacterized RDD family membrane protein YckC